MGCNFVQYWWEKLKWISNKTIYLRLEEIMSTVEEVQATLAEVNQIVVKVSADVDNLQAQIAALQAGTVTQDQLDSLAAAADAIKNSLSEVDAKTPE